jgi:hypothetical protein
MLRPGALALSLAAGCGVVDDTGPQVVRVFAAPEGSPRDFAFIDERLDTLESARRIRGEASHLRGGGSLVLEEALFSGQLTADTEEQVRRYDLITGDGPVEAQYERDEEVLVPTDWETLLMFTFYRHMERARAYYESLGVETAALPTLRSYFNIRLTAMLVVWGQPLLTDNAAYTPFADSFMLFPTNLIDDGLPLPMNQGVVAHELSHAVKHHVLHGDRRLPRYIDESWPAEAIASYRADDEGLADFFAAVFTGDPDFIHPSIPDLDLDRDLEVDRNFTQAQYDALSQGSLDFNPYSLGSSLASWLWDMGATDVERRQLAVIVVETLYALRDTIDGTYSLNQLMGEILARLPADMRARGCDLLDQRLEGEFREVPACSISP